MKLQNIPFDLIYELNKKDNEGVNIFLGAGISYNSGIPASKQLIETIKQDPKNILNSFINDSNMNIWKLAEICRNEGAEKLFREFITNNLSTFYNSEISPEYRILQFLIRKGYIKKVYTTNIDCMLDYVLDKDCIQYNKYSYEKSYQNNNLDLHNNISRLNYIPNINGNCDIIKICGDIHSPSNMCFSLTDIKELVNTDLFKNFITDLSNNKTFIFIGYSFYEDTIGNSISKYMSERNQPIFVVNVSRKDELKLRGNYVYFEESAESFLKRLVHMLNPKLQIDHITFDDGGFGGVQTYYQSLKKIMLKYLPEKVTYDSHPVYNVFKKYKSADEDFKGLPRMRSASSMTLYDLASKKDKGDVIHAHNSISAYHAHSLGLPVVLTSHSLLSSEILYDRSQDLYNAQKEVEYWDNEYYSSLPYIIALSDEHRKELPYGIRHCTRIMDAPFYLKPFLDKEIIDYSSEEARKKIKNKVFGGEKGIFDTKKFTIAFVGRCTVRKGIEIVHKVFEELFYNYQNNVQLLYIGPELYINENIIEYKPSESSSGDYNSNLQKYTASFVNSVFFYKNDISDDLYTHLKDMSIGYKAADVIIAPSIYEPFGYVAIEALASKRLIIAGKTGGFKETLANNRGELIDVDIKDQSSIKMVSHNFFLKIKDLIVQDYGNNLRLNDKVNETIKNGFDYIINHYNDDNQKKLAEEIYAIYLNSITTGNSLTISNDSKLMGISNEKINSLVFQLLKERLENQSSLDEIMYTVSLAYLDIVDLLEIFEGNSINNILKRENLNENYNLFWELAGFLKRNNPMCKAIKIMGTRTLAETITESTRCLYNIIKHKSKLASNSDRINDILLNKNNLIFNELIAIYIEKENYRKVLIES